MNTTSSLTILNTQLGAINTTLQNIVIALQIQPFWNTQWFAAVVGAAIGLIPSFYLLYKDRAIIKVEIGHALIPFPPNNRVRSGLWAKITNTGRRPITISSFFLKFKNGETIVFLNDNLFVGGSGLPKILGESNSHSVTILAGTIAGDFLKKNDYPITACYRDAVGKVYETKISEEFWDNFFKVSSGDL